MIEHRPAGVAQRCHGRGNRVKQFDGYEEAS